MTLYVFLKNQFYVEMSSFNVHCIRVNVVSYTKISPNILRYHAWCWLHTANIGLHYSMWTDVCLSSDWLEVYACKHRYTLKNVNRCLRALANIGTHWKIFFVEAKTKFHWENHILPNTMRISWLCLGHIGKYGPHASKWGANVTPPACGRRGTLTPHFSAYRAIFSDMSSPESGYCSIVLAKKINFSTLGSQIFADLQPHFPRFVCILHTNLGKWSFPCRKRKLTNEITR